MTVAFDVDAAEERRLGGNANRKRCIAALELRPSADDAVRDARRRSGSDARALNDGGAVQNENCASDGAGGESGDERAPSTSHILLYVRVAPYARRVCRRNINIVHALARMRAARRRLARSLLLLCAAPLPSPPDASRG